jgi:hypothetical protein
VRAGGGAEVSKAEQTAKVTSATLIIAF